MLCLPHIPWSLRVASIKNNLAELLRMQSRFQEAQDLFEEAISIFQKHHGEDHHTVAMALTNLAILHRSQENYSEAEKLYRRSLQIREQSLGPVHPTVASLLNNLAVLLEKQVRNWNSSQAIFHDIGCLILDDDLTDASCLCFCTILYPSNFAHTCVCSY